jgi:hypothetical protein
VFKQAVGKFVQKGGNVIRAVYVINGFFVWRPVKIIARFEE